MDERCSFMKSVHCMPILIAVRDNPGSSKRELFELIGGSTGARAQSLGRLIRSGLIDEEDVKDSCGRKSLTITEKGARLLDALEFIIGDEDGPLDP